STMKKLPSLSLTASFTAYGKNPVSFTDIIHPSEIHVTFSWPCNSLWPVYIIIPNISEMNTELFSLLSASVPVVLQTVKNPSGDLPPDGLICSTALC
ncbi:MAG: hypothetical protein J5966_01170, partial [Lachnospiraceae bacterium]|nr:hypothetical protein [Lachnospiraceae bacterium]